MLARLALSHGFPYGRVESGLMMRDDLPSVRHEGAVGETPRLRRWYDQTRHWDQAKLTPLTVVAFIGLLAVFALAAAGIGYLTHHIFER